MFGFQRREVRTCECETLLPKLGCLAHTSQVDATVVLLGVSRQEGGEFLRRRTPWPDLRAAVVGRTRHQAQQVRNATEEAYPTTPAATNSPRLGSVSSTDGVLRLNPVDRSLTKALGARTGTALGKLGLRTIGDLLTHYPRRYVMPGKLTSLADLVMGERVLIVVDVVSFTARPMRNRRGSVVTVEVSDGIGHLPMVFFPPHQGRVTYLERQLKPGRRIMVEGTVGDNRGVRQLVHPEFEDFDESEDEAQALERRLRPRPSYPATAAASSQLIRLSVRTLLDPMPDQSLLDPVPLAIREAEGLITHADAMRQIHNPATVDEYKAAQKALRFEEAFVLQAAMARRRAEAAGQLATARPPIENGLLEAFDDRLPFTLTDGQIEVGATLSAEISRTEPMQRLLQGEVGSGKTVAALRAMLQIVDGGGQAALLAPTEVLAAQHYRSITAMLGPLAEGGMLTGTDNATRVTLLTGSQSAAQRRQALGEAAGGSAGIVIGTHAIIQDHVQFADLGLVVVDEQHRFGVEQRDALRAKGRTSPHLLVMTATPIPRTVAMTIFGDLEISTLKELPLGRAPITTHLVADTNELWLRRTWHRMAEEVAQDRRVFVVCPRISAGTAEDDGSDDAPPLDAEGETKRELNSVESMVEMLRAMPILDGIEIGTLHGRMSGEDKDAAMAAFSSGRTPILVTTTVIEVGVDVPQASLMVVMDADRFGLAQLHQLRGRVGRGGTPGVCLAIAPVPDKVRGEPDPPSVKRLEAFASTIDGFELAEADLKERREGNVLGASQAGRTSSLRLLRVMTDAKIIERARKHARAVVAEDPALDQHPYLDEAIRRALNPESEEFLERN